jgi:hypothetical protein
MVEKARSRPICCRGGRSLKRLAAQINVTIGETHPATGIAMGTAHAVKSRIASAERMIAMIRTAG